MWLIKVQYTKYKNPRWVIVDPKLPEYVRAIQKSRKTASQFQTREAAEKVAAQLGNLDARKVEIVACF